MEYVLCRLSKGKTERVELCPVVKTNPLTVWVRLPDGHIIKRHKNKHCSF